MSSRGLPRPRDGVVEIDTARQAAKKSHCPRCLGVFAKDNMVRFDEEDSVSLYCTTCWAEVAPRLAERQARATTLNGYYQRKYGIGVKEYGDLLLSQGGSCAICDRTPTKPLVVDHDHETGAVRGLLCGACNTALGTFGDDVGRLAAAITYLARANSWTRAAAPA